MCVNCIPNDIPVVLLTTSVPCMLHSIKPSALMGVCISRAFGSITTESGPTKVELSNLGIVRINAK